MNGSLDTSGYNIEQTNSTSSSRQQQPQSQQQQYSSYLTPLHHQQAPISPSQSVAAAAAAAAAHHLFYSDMSGYNSQGSHPGNAFTSNPHFSMSNNPCSMPTPQFVNHNFSNLNHSPISPSNTSTPPSLSHLLPPLSNPAAVQAAHHYAAAYGFGNTHYTSQMIDPSSGSGLQGGLVDL